MSLKFDLLPDSRLNDRERKVVHGFHSIQFGYIDWVPVFCANCGKPYGKVPEATCTFAFWLCDLCAEKWGDLAGTMVMPDDVFAEKMRQAMLEEYGRVLSPEELLRLAEAGTDSFSKLLREGEKL